MNASGGRTGFEILAVGEILWDLLPAGKQLGGAPANFAYHAHALGARVHLVSRVGDDPPGFEILDRLHALGVATDCVAADPAAPTGTVSVELSADGQPQFTIHEDVAWDRIQTDEGLLELAARAQAVCFGSLAQRREPSRTSIRRLVSATPAGALRVFDINIRQHFYSAELIEESLRLATVLKLNDQELVLLAAIFGLVDDARGQLTALARRFGLDTVALTRGAGGSLLMSDGVWSEHPGLPAKVADTVGAGDAFTAAMTLGLLAGWPLDRVNCRANEIASYVCSQSGATPKLPEELRGTVTSVPGTSARDSAPHT
jgi:fructokinase